MTADDLMRAIELLHRRQHQAVVELIADPDDAHARQRYRQSTVQIFALRMRLPHNVQVRPSNTSQAKPSLHRRLQPDIASIDAMSQPVAMTFPPSGACNKNKPVSARVC